MQMKTLTGTNPLMARIHAHIAKRPNRGSEAIRSALAVWAAENGYSDSTIPVYLSAMHKAGVLMRTGERPYSYRVKSNTFDYAPILAQNREYNGTVQPKLVVSDDLQATLVGLIRREGVEKVMMAAVGAIESIAVAKSKGAKLVRK